PRHLLVGQEVGHSRGSGPTSSSSGIIDNPFARVEGMSARRMVRPAPPPKDTPGRRGGRKNETSRSTPPTSDRAGRIPAPKGPDKPAWGNAPGKERGDIRPHQALKGRHTPGKGVRC